MSKHLIVLLALAAGCTPVPAPTTAAKHTDPTARWASEIRRVARDGDWVLIASGDEIDHSSIFDAKTAHAIDASGTVRELPLEKLLADHHYVIVVRPRMSVTNASASLARARMQLGAKFDGEIVVWAAQTEARFGSAGPASELVKYGEVIYWSPGDRVASGP